MSARKTKNTPESNAKISEALKGNTNAEVWTELEATEFFNKALVLSESTEYDFIGEIAKELKTYKSVFTYLSDKYPSLKQLHETIIGNCETNCFCNAKKGKIKEATAIVNLKSNHGWTDRQQLGVSGGVTLNFDSEDAKA